MRSSFVSVCATLAVLLLCGPVHAAVIFSGSGINPEVSANASGQATFTISGNSLTLALQNTTSPRTTAQGNAMTGVVFNISGANPVLALTGTSLTSGSAIWTSELASNTSDPLAGSWTNVLGGSPLASYGVATTGFSGRFNGGSISLGNAGPDYGMVAAGTFDGTNVAFGGSQFPFIQDSLTFTFSGLAGISESQIADVQLLFGTDGTGIITTTNTLIPEPTTWLICAGLIACYSCRRPARIVRV